MPLDALDDLVGDGPRVQARTTATVAAMDRDEMIRCGAYVYFTFLKRFAEVAAVADELDWTVPRDIPAALRPGGRHGRRQRAAGSDRRLLRAAEVTFGAGDEQRHAPGTDPAWTETWVFDAWAPDASIGTFTWLTLSPAGAGRGTGPCSFAPGNPSSHVADVDRPVPDAGLRVRTTGLWAEHVCEAPFEQWTVQNECHAVALDDPADALGRAFGESAPLAFDVEWYATRSGRARCARLPPGRRGHAVIELAGGPLTGTGGRRHCWGGLPDDGAGPPACPPTSARTIWW